MTSVRYAHPENGYAKDQQMARLYLKVGKTYRVTRTAVHSWFTDLYLQELPGIPFNSVLFEEV